MKYNKKMFTLRKKKKTPEIWYQHINIIIFGITSGRWKIIRNFHFSSFYIVVGKHLSCCCRHVAQWNDVKRENIHATLCDLKLCLFFPRSSVALEFTVLIERIFPHYELLLRAIRPHEQRLNEPRMFMVCCLLCRYTPCIPIMCRVKQNEISISIQEYECAVFMRGKRCQRGKHLSSTVKNGTN